MNTTTTAPFSALPNLATAQRELAQLKSDLEDMKPLWAAAEEAAGDGYRAAAAGRSAGTEAAAEIDSLISRERILRAQVKRAEAVLAKVQGRAVIRAVLEANQAGKELAAANSTIAAKVAAHLDGVASGLTELLANNVQILNLVHAVRGRSTATDDGELAMGDLASLTRAEHLQTLVERHMNATLGWYRCDAPLLHRRPAFDESVAGTNGVLLQMLDILFELPKVDQEEVEAVRAEMRRERVSRGDIVAAGSSTAERTSRDAQAAAEEEALSSQFIDMETI